mgnify:FL=1
MGARIEPNKNIPNRGRDERHFRQGEIWIIDDQQIAIPDSEITGRTVHEFRPVVILSDYCDNCNPNYPLLLVAPLCSIKANSPKAIADVEVYPKDGVRDPSYVKVGLIQPILKVYLQHKVGELTLSALDRVLAILDIITGAESPEIDESAVYETAAGGAFDDSLP